MTDVARETFAYYALTEGAVGIPPRVAKDMLAAYDRVLAEREKSRKRVEELVAGELSRDRNEGEWESGYVAALEAVRALLREGQEQ